jgi:predicted ATP-binding protein involved in virulence
MELHRLDISNFRCFEEYHITFKPGVNILYGLNGAGKTTLIHAICKALSFIMASDSVPAQDGTKKKGVHSIANGNPKLRVDGYSPKGDFYLSANGEGCKTTKAEITIEAAGKLDYIPLNWSITALSKNPRLRKSGYMDAFRTFWEWHTGTNRLPVLAYYSDGFPHVEDKSHVSEKIASLRNFGYYEWDNEEACSRIWLERMERSLKELERMERRQSNGKSYMDVPKLESRKQEISMIEKCFRAFSEHDSFIEVDSFELSAFDDQLCVRSSDGRLFAFRQLPAGYKRMFYILLDIAYRSYILNQSVDATGIVIIDEIDLHLHPGLEKVVLNRFQKVFPHLQFIISTHSPLVITSMKTDTVRNCIYRMTPDTTAPQILGDVYGLDYNSGIEDVMQVASSDEKLERLLSTYVYMFKNDLKQQAENLKSGILSEYGMDPERLEKMINNKMITY